MRVPAIAPVAISHSILSARSFVLHPNACHFVHKITRICQPRMQPMNYDASQRHCTRRFVSYVQQRAMCISGIVYTYKSIRRTIYTHAIPNSSYLRDAISDAHKTADKHITRSHRPQNIQYIFAVNCSHW